MRMIGADMLADGLKLHRQSTDQKHETDRQWAVGYNAGLERALYSISYAPSLTPPNEWVSVEDELPKLPDCDKCSMMVNTARKGNHKSFPMIYERAIVRGKRVNKGDVKMNKQDAIKCLKSIQQWVPDFDDREDGLSYWDALDMAIDALDPPNEPLTLAELREMDGEPVWDEKGKCYLVDTTYQFCSDSDIEIAIVDKRGIKRYPYRRTLYRRPPEGETDE